MSSMDTNERLFDFESRISSLEASKIHDTEIRKNNEEEIKAIRLMVNDVNTSVGALTSKLEKWEGKFGAFLFLIGCVWTFLLAAWSSIVEFVRFKLGGA